MNNLEKLLRKASSTDRDFLPEVLRKIKQGDTKNLRIDKLSGNKLYKI